MEYLWDRIQENAAQNSYAIVVLSIGGVNQAPGESNIIERKDPYSFLLK